ncbi:hypothetical protein FHU38_003126 [Saccharomonospora amisosensis]|uniref:DUF308 domain-containing protein n=1 Tax=Saccharomonospora amisosensis TaxID=1128677 RepID=A0A7X5URC5_9PSEU|nr:hypothetical protein [Saccharomonospora amisosensis]NIJ12782.1 hypothetical protein [Saccharomonospora amisosensis]
MSRLSGADGPEDVDATFERIVADLRAQGVGAHGDEPDDLDDFSGGADTEDRTDRTDSTGTADTRSPRESEPRTRELGEPEATRASGGWRESETGWDETMFGPDPGNDEHYVPPEPPPLPRPRKGAFIVLLFFVVGLLLLISPGVIGLNSTIGTPLGMLALAIGIALGLLRVRQGPPDGADPTNGAQV